MRSATPGHPILMKPELVRALLAGRKTQSRRVVVPQPGGKDQSVKVENGWLMCRRAGVGWCNDTRCPYGVPGDLLWVRETHYRWGKWVKNGKTPTGLQRWRFKVMRAPSNSDVEFDDEIALHGVAKRRTDTGWHKRPSIFMPRWASRLTLRLTEVRVQRVQAITQKDVFAEGLTNHEMNTRYEGAPAQLAFARLWDAINRDRGYVWEANPWVWCLSFTIIQANVDEVLKEAA